jgi:glyoxalase family protein
VRPSPDGVRATQGVGSVHHVAFRVADEAAQLRAQEQVRAAGGRTTEVIDRFWFKSIYFREPGGALFEIATDGPGFAIDEELSSLGEQLILPPFLQPHRAEIERALAPVTEPRVSGARSPGCTIVPATSHVAVAGMGGQLCRVAASGHRCGRPRVPAS